MIFRAALFFTYLSLKAALGIASAVNPSFKRLLMEKDLSFVVRSSASDVSRLFRLRRGRLGYSRHIEGFVNFSAVWNGWGEADTLRKKLRLNAVDLMNTGMMTFEGDLSSMDYLLVLLGEMVGSFRKKISARLERAELGKEPS